MAILLSHPRRRGRLVVGQIGSATGLHTYAVLDRLPGALGVTTIVGVVLAPFARVPRSPATRPAIPRQRPWVALAETKRTYPSLRVNDPHLGRLTRPVVPDGDCIGQGASERHRIGRVGVRCVR